MADLNRIVSDNLALVVGVLVVVLVILLIAVIAQSRRLGRAVHAYRTLVGEGQAGSLGDVLDGQVARSDAMGKQLTELNARHAGLEQRALSSIQHVGLVRFNPFEDTGSDQSFAIALLDARRDGLVISSLHGRAGTRVFAKPVENGTSTHNLSEEEKGAIRMALGNGGTGDGNRS